MRRSSAAALSHRASQNCDIPSSTTSSDTVTKEEPSLARKQGNARPRQMATTELVCLWFSTRGKASDQWLVNAGHNARA
jgi:hypothetical protein